MNKEFIMKEEITYEKTFNSHPINTDKEHGLGCYTKILRKTDNVLNSMIKDHSKIMTVRFDIRFPINANIENYRKLMSEFDYNLKRKLNRERISGGHKVDAKTIYVEEQNKGENPHYHFATIVNANAKHKYYDILQTVSELWMNQINSKEEGLVDYCNKHKNGMIIDKNSDNFNEIHDKVFHQLSYLAKVKSKENKDKGSWLVRGSR